MHSNFNPSEDLAGNSDTMILGYGSLRLAVSVQQQSGNKMIKLGSLSAVLLCVLASLSNVAALPTAENAVEVIPGPGLPSLASLGLTSADLFKKVIIAARDGAPQLSKRFTDFCQTTDLVNRDNAIACYNYLNALGTTACGVDTNIDFCVAGDAHIGGSSIVGRHVSSYCRDVATGALWIINNCNINNRVEGAATAYGNGDLIVSIEPWSA
ncbi:hypothetical protein NLJ89_g6434 [Agrocybe chaxingu]|uniref:Uncharacterized protein n=1 Tax=Agrocybe chaxingu TaxID=84603 RepID=A0A9W8JYB3_9AGAR|nr:hypothetical protein NLJ89_g6434 [Agrocybe chaxingu]